MSTFTDVREQLGTRLQSYNFEVFKEPRGIMRILQLVFSLLTVYVLRSYEGYIVIKYCDPNNASYVRLPIEYPFDLDSASVDAHCNTTSSKLSLKNDFSSEAEFLFAICLISIIFSIVISFVYVKFREDYESNGNLALVDFIISVILAVLWIACSGAWGYGQSQMKKFTDPDFVKQDLVLCDKNHLHCLDVTRGSVLGLTESLIFSFLDFFLWAAGLWFLYKETPWYLNFQRA